MVEDPFWVFELSLPLFFLSYQTPPLVTTVVLDANQASFSKGTLVAFRQRLIEGQMDWRLIERTIGIASQSQAFGSRALRAALDSSPLWGAGRVEDTYNLVGHARRKVMRVVASQQGREVAEVASEAGTELVCGSSLKVALDRDWDQ